MNLNSVWPGVCWGLLVCCVATPGTLRAACQEVPDEFRSRVHEIYQESTWRSEPWQAEWLPDSSGYTLRRPRAEANERGPFTYDVLTGQQISPAAPANQDEMVDPNGQRRLVWRRDRWWIDELDSDRAWPLIDEEPRADVFVRRPQWSPDGTAVLIVESDEQAVRRRAMLVPTDPSYPAVQERRFARVGEVIPKLRVGMVPVSVTDQTPGSVTWLDLQPPTPDFYLGQVEWVGAQQQVLVEILSRFRDQREFWLFDIPSGESTCLFKEANDAWAVASQGRNLGLIWVAQHQRFIVISEKAGWRQAYLYDRQGSEIAVLTPGTYDIIERVGVDPGEEWFYFYASPDDATQRYLYRVPLSGQGEPQRITPREQPGTHNYQFSPDWKWAFHTYSDFDTPPVTDLIELATHRSVRMIEDNHELKTRLAETWPNATEFFRLEVEDGVTVDAWMLKPRGFDPSRRYPVFVYVYGEPHAQTVLDAWGSVHDLFHRAIADLGYIVVSIDNRGTPAPKGAAWRRSVFGRLGPLSTRDQAQALRVWQRQCPYLDLDRVGIWGWSGGGSNTLNAMFREPTLYRVGIAVVPKPQPHLYNAWFQEIYMRTPEVNPDGYAESAPLNYAHGLQGKLLIITGSGETNTHIQIIEGLVDKLIELGKVFDYMVYPNRDHGLSEGPGSVVHVRNLIGRYLWEHLPAGPR